MDNWSSLHIRKKQCNMLQKIIWGWFSKKKTCWLWKYNRNVYSVNCPGPRMWYSTSYNRTEIWTRNNYKCFLKKKNILVNADMSQWLISSYFNDIVGFVNTKKIIFAQSQFCHLFWEYPSWCPLFRENGYPEIRKRPLARESMGPRDQEQMQHTESMEPDSFSLNIVTRIWISDRWQLSLLQNDPKFRAPFPAWREQNSRQYGVV